MKKTNHDLLSMSGYRNGVQCDTWLIKLGLALANLVLRLQRNPFRGFLHPSQAVDAIVGGNGLKRIFYGKTVLWQVVVYAR